MMTLEKRVAFVDDEFDKITEIKKCADGQGRHVNYEHQNGSLASVVWHPRTGAHFVFGPVRHQWEKLGSERSFLGYPVSEQMTLRTLGKPAGWFTLFEGGVIVFSGTCGNRVYRWGPGDQWYDIDGQFMMDNEVRIAILEACKVEPVLKKRTKPAQRDLQTEPDWRLQLKKIGSPSLQSSVRPQQNEISQAFKAYSGGEQTMKNSQIELLYHVEALGSTLDE